MTIVRATFYSIGLMIGNLICQAMSAAPNWGIAYDRSFFQAVAVIGSVLLTRAWSFKS